MEYCLNAPAPYGVRPVVKVACDSQSSHAEGGVYLNMNACVKLSYVWLCIWCLVCVVAHVCLRSAHMRLVG